ncbi:uncharacterized protein LOC121387618 [Gigantopelta aegis]|uniref:uncharacterized protein LOC121387618 n=1 Tax=Gigantopelta aegis TaxID=1735272 RepID=UPI001B88B376|nr:uncharacterized protein LOC121387618 [Gigantopelta aegis]
MEFANRIVYLLLTFHSVFCVELFPEVIQTDEQVEFKECYGTSVGFAISGNLSDHYQALRRHFHGCTFVNGNLEITNLVSMEIHYDLDFLKDIEIVTGYVLIGLVTEVDTISLPKLILIRADSTFAVLGSEYGLVVTLTSRNETSGLRTLHMPALKEISRGQVLFLENPLLCHVDTIDWDHMTPNRENVLHMIKQGHSKNCEPCSSHCLAKNVSRCWGPEDNLCQQVNSMHCTSMCLNHCFDTGVFGCCHPECAVGCTGPLDTDCHMCKYFKHNDRCVSSCPDDHYFAGQHCILNPFLFTSTDNEHPSMLEFQHATEAETKMAELNPVQTESKGVNSRQTADDQAYSDFDTDIVDDYFRLHYTVNDPFTGEDSSPDSSTSPQAITENAATPLFNTDTATSTYQLADVEIMVTNSKHIADESPSTAYDSLQHYLSPADATAAIESPTSADPDPPLNDGPIETDVSTAVSESEIKQITTATSTPDENTVKDPAEPESTNLTNSTEEISHVSVTADSVGDDNGNYTATVMTNDSAVYKDGDFKQTNHSKSYEGVDLKYTNENMISHDDYDDDDNDTQ